MDDTFASATILLLLITDPLGNIPVFANALRQVPRERRAWVILRENLIAFGLLLALLHDGVAGPLLVERNSNLTEQVRQFIMLSPARACWGLRSAKLHAPGWRAMPR